MSSSDGSETKKVVEYLCVEAQWQSSKRSKRLDPTKLTIQSSIVRCLEDVSIPFPIPKRLA